MQLKQLVNHAVSPFKFIAKNKLSPYFLGLSVVVSLVVMLFVLPIINSRGYAQTASDWTNTGSMNEGRSNFGSTLLQNGKVIVFGGQSHTEEGDIILLSSAEIYDPTNGTWNTTGAMNAPRQSFLTVTLPNGKVLITGGVSSGEHVSSSELYDPSNGTWTSAASMPEPRIYATATVLAGGKILVTGGERSNQLSYSTAEIYDPSTDTWSPTGSMNASRSRHTATVLSDGKVLVVGGAYRDNPSSSFVYRTSAEIYDPATGTWSPTGSITSPRFEHTSTLLANGKVLLVGGYIGGDDFASTELYDPVTGTWTAAGDLNNKRRLHTATLLSDGSVLATGGSGNSGTPFYLTSAELYDPVSDTWTNTASLSDARFYHEAILLSNDRVLAVGGNTSGRHLATAELYTALTPNPTWTYTGSMNESRAGFAIALLQNDKVLVTGSSNVLATTTTDLYDSTTGVWNATGSVNIARNDFPTAVTLANGKVLLAGGYGYDNGGVLAAAELYNPTTGAWTYTGSMNVPRTQPTITLLSDGRVLAAGGYDIVNNISVEHASSEIYDPTTETWTLTGSMSSPRYFHRAVLLADGKVLVSGGNGGPTSATALSAELYDPNTGTWTQTGSTQRGRVEHTLTRLNNGKVLVVGSTMSPSSLTELYDPATGIWTASGNLNTGRRYTTSTLLSDGRVLVAGGSTADISQTQLASSELYDPVGGVWSLTTPMNVARVYHSTVLLSDDQVLAVGGNSNGTNLASAELYSKFPPTNTPTPTITPTPAPHDEPTTTANIAPSALENGEYPDPVQVTLSASAASGFSVEDTYYQIDSNAQQPYTGPFTVSDAGEHTIIYWSVDNTGLEETPHKTQTFTISSTVHAAQVSPGQETVTIGNTTVSFSEVTSPGYVLIEELDSNPDGPIPPRYSTLNTFYNITTTATYTGPVTVTVHYIGEDAIQDPRLLHNDGSGWEDITQTSTLIDAGTFTYEIVGISSSLSPFAIVEENQPNKLTSLNPTKVWVGLGGIFGAGAKFDLKAEAYKDTTLVSSGQINSVNLGLVGFGGFSSAKLQTIPFNTFTPVDFPQGSKLSIKVYARTTCTGSLSPLGTARLWYNDSQANSQFGATIGTDAKMYYLRNNFLLGTTVGTGPKKSADVQGGAACSAFKSFGTWTITP